jgi:rod shape determining protein RodA
MRAYKRLLRRVDWFFLLITLLLCVLGLENLWSASHQMGLTPFKRQLVWFCISVAVCIALALLDYKTVERYAYHLYTLTVLTLVLVLAFGKEISGSKSWLSLGGIASIQPSELAKIGIIVALARYYEGCRKAPPYGVREVLQPLVIVGVPVLLVLLQPDFGTAMMICLISGSVILFMGVRLKLLLIAVLTVACVSFPTWEVLLRDYQKERIMTFLDPSRDPLGAGYNAIQSQIAVGSGRLFGKGLMQGSQAQLRFIPEQHTDFAFSVIGEELGFVGAASTVVLFFLIALFALDAGSKAKDKFAGVVCVGVASLFFWHMLINIGMVTGMLPVTGVPLLLVSYGGSSVLTAMTGIGLVLGVKMRRLKIPAQEIEH